MEAEAAPETGAVARRRLSRPVAVVLLTTPGLLAFGVPFVGIVLSGLAAFLSVARTGPVLWDLAGRRWWLVAALGFGALWLPSVLSMIGAFRIAPDDPATWVVATSLLLMPLCGPESPLVPVTVAVLVYAGGAGLSAALGRPWPWVLGGAAATVAYGVAVQITPVSLIC